MSPTQFFIRSLQDSDPTLRQEWSETNPIGVSASSTIIGANSRKSHGLLTIPAACHLEWNVFLSGLDEILLLGDDAYPLSTQYYAGTVYPEGYRNMDHFTLVPFPTWIFRVEDLVLAKSLILLRAAPIVLIRYQILEGDEHWVRFEVRPLIAVRQNGCLSREKTVRLGAPVMLENGGVYVSTLAPAVSTSSLFFHHNAAIADRGTKWYRAVCYPEDQKLELEFEEDLYSPFRLQYTFLREREAFLCASNVYQQAPDFSAWVEKEENRRLKSA